MPKSLEQFKPITSNETEPKPKLGDFVTAALFEQTADQPWSDTQGVFIKDNEDGTVLLQGPYEHYVCKGPEGMSVVQDENLLGSSLRLAIEERMKLRL